MAKNIANVDILTDTFNTWLLRTNDIIDVINSDVLTANSTQGVTGSPASPRNALLYGSFTANTIAGDTVTLGSNFVANSSTLLVGANLRFIANGSSGSTGQILTTDGTKVYWSTASGTGTVTQIANGAGIYFTDLPGGVTGSPITSSGTIRIRAGDGSITIDSRGVSVNTSFLAGSLTNATTLQNRTWEIPGAIGATTANTGRFTTVTAGISTGYRLEGDSVFLISNSVFRTAGFVDATTPNSGSTGGVRVRGNPTSGVAYIQVTDATGSTEWGNFKAHSNGYIAWSGALVGGNYPNLIPAGTVMLFAQTNAPVGWTKITTHDNKALRVVSGAAGSGGSTTFTGAFNTVYSTDGTALTIDQMPAHYHGAGITQSFDTKAMAYGYISAPTTVDSYSQDGTDGIIQPITETVGGSASHSHTFNFDVAYVDVILASKN